MNSTIPNSQGIKKYIRFNGLIGFVVIMTLIITLLYLFAETLVKQGIEQGGGLLLGAEVNVESVELNYSPFIVTVNGLQATDAEQPSYNMVSFKQASAGIDVWQYLLGKTIIEQLEIEALEFMTKRTEKGEVYQPEKTDNDINAEAAVSLLPAVDIQLPDIKTLLQTDDLLTVKAAENLQKSYEEESQKLAALKSKLPSKAKLQAYQVKVKAIGQMKIKSLADFNLVKAEFDALKKAFKADQATVKQAKQQLLASKERLAKQVTILKNAPNDDWKNIEKKYQLESVNTEDFAHLLFGEKARGYYQTAESFYQRIAPMLNTSDNNAVQDAQSHTSGRFVHFDEDEPLPEFLIKTAKISLVLEQGDFVIDGGEFTHQHWYRAKPSLLTFKSNNLFATGQMTINSQFEIAKSGDLSGEGQWVFKQLTLENVELNQSDSLSLTLTQGELAGHGEFKVNQQAQSNHIVSANHLVLENASYQGNAKNTFATMLLDTFKSLNNLTLDMNIEGDIADPKLTMSSSLDKALSGAFEQQIANKLSEFKGEVNAGLNEKLTKSLTMASEGKSALVDFEALLSDTDNALETLKNSDVVKQQQKKLQDKATDKLKSKLSDLFG